MSDLPHDLLHNTPNNADLPVPFDPMAYNPRLWEGLPSQTNRYDDTNAGPRKKRYVETGVLHATQEHDQHADIHIVPVREGWYEYHHPVEGRPYFYNPELKLVTEMYIRHENVLDRLMEWHRTFVILRDRVLPDAAAFDVYLDCSGGNTCRYYLVDHANRTICWLRQRTTADLGISDVRNKLHLRALLYEEYWTHTEYMPKNENHLGATRAELEGAIASSMLGKTHSRYAFLALTRPYLDHMTSEGSTSPFTTEECKAYLLGLDKAAESGHMLYLNWSIARIMGLLVHSRNVNVYGQFGARLDRTATVEGRRHPPRGPGYLYQSSLYGGGPVIHLNRLENLWVDRIIYTHHWRALLKDLNDEWTGAAIAAGVMWASNMAFIAGDGVGTVAKVICGLSAILAGACGVYSLHLMREHRALGKYAAHAANYFQLYESHQTGLQELSIRYSTPWAGVMWSFGFTCAAIVFHLFSTILLLAGAYTHVLVTMFLVVGVYVHARGVDLVVSDLQRLPFRLGLAHRHPQTPVARTIAPPNDEPPIYALDDPPANLHSQLQNPPVYQAYT